MVATVSLTPHQYGRIRTRCSGRWSLRSYLPGLQTKKKIRHLSNRKILQMPDAFLGFLFHNETGVIEDL